MRVANKLTPKTKSKATETKPEHRPQQFQDKTLQLLVPNSKRLGGYTGDTQEHKVCQDNDLNQVVYTAQMKARQALDRSRKFVKTTIYTELFTRHRRKPDKHSADQESLSRQRSTYTE